MDEALLVARLLLAAVFGVAGGAKLADFPGSTKNLREFGVPRAFIAPMAFALPLIELSTAGLVVPVSSAWWGALGALVLLLVFIAVIGANLVQGYEPDCHCFGQLHSAPAGWQTLARNGVLAAIAGFVVWQGRPHPGPSAVAWLGALSTMQVVLLITGLAITVALVAQGWLLVQLLRQHGRLLLRLDALESALPRARAGLLPLRPAPSAPSGLPVDAPAPGFRLPNLSGEFATLDNLRAGDRSVALTFVDPGCGPCAALVPELARLQSTFDFLVMVLVSRGSPPENREKFGSDLSIPVLLQANREVAEAYQVHGTPGTVVVRPDGTIGSAVALGAAAIVELLARSATAVAIPAEGSTSSHSADDAKLMDVTSL
ncbi:TlpA family protein disulfide reductase [Bradyrhizobium sp. UFLA05-153]